MTGKTHFAFSSRKKTCTLDGTRTTEGCVLREPRDRRWADLALDREARAGDEAPLRRCFRQATDDQDWVAGQFCQNSTILANFSGLVLGCIEIDFCN